jgi:hypothetical protein
MTLPCALAIIGRRRVKPEFGVPSMPPVAARWFLRLASVYALLLKRVTQSAPAPRLPCAIATPLVSRCCGDAVSHPDSYKKTTATTRPAQSTRHPPYSATQRVPVSNHAARTGCPDQDLVQAHVQLSLLRATTKCPNPLLLPTNPSSGETVRHGFLCSSATRQRQLLSPPFLPHKQTLEELSGVVQLAGSSTDAATIGSHR